MSGLPLTRLIPELRVPLAATAARLRAPDPGPSAAVLQGIFAGAANRPHSHRAAPVTTPALVSAPPRPVHPFLRRGLLAEYLPTRG